MLKDIFKKNINKNNDKNEKMLLSLMDGYVDIKAYKHNEKGERKLIYHNTGDNTVTNWMRQVIMLLLSGYSLSTNGTTIGNTDTGIVANAADANQFSKPTTGSHSDEKNTDGYCLNGKQYLDFFNNSNTSSTVSVQNNYYPVLNNSNLWGANSSEQMYALFPTKILLGTGCEYTDWDTLREFNETDNAAWYSDIVQQYGNGDVATAKVNFNTLVGADSQDNSRYLCNSYSGTIGVQGNFTGNGSMLPAVTVNDPDTTSNITSSADMSKRYGVVGAIKTLYLPSNATDTVLSDTAVLETTVSDSGRLETGKFRGAGRPCFIYFRRNATTGNDNPADWDKQTSDVFVSKDSESAFLNRITFRIVIPAQSSGTAAVGEYNPFNGYTFKQVGLFNDAIFATDTSNEKTRYSANMPCGMLLAIKNIQSFTKTADESIEFTWTLTI